MAEHQPLWRSVCSDPTALQHPYGRGLAGPIPIPAYVQRWLAVQGSQAPRSGVPTAQALAADILIIACLRWHKAAPPLPFELLRGFACEDCDPAPRDDDRDRQTVTVLNHHYAYVFALRGRTPDAFRGWVAKVWSINRRKVDRAGWPIIVLQPGSWPIDVRLHPGGPLAAPELG